MVTNVCRTMLGSAFALGVILVTPAAAHTIASGAGGLTTGALHPLTGLDHLLAMVSVGVWGVELGGTAIWLLPIVFPLVMAFGGALGVIGVPLPGSELLVALSVLVLGALVLYRRRVRLPLALAIIAVFAIAHGHAHGSALPSQADPLAFTIGFVGATGLLHLAGIMLGLLVRFPIGAVAVRAGGGLVFLSGCYFLYSHAAA